jgi:hypothetical protein
MANAVFWAECRVILRGSDVSEEHYLHLKDRILSQVRNQQNQATNLASAGFLLSLLSDLEDGGSMFFCNAGFSPNYKVLQPSRP